MNCFIDQNMVLDRLCNDFDKHGKLIVAVDFDNTLYDYHGIGLDCSWVIDIVKFLHEQELADIIIWTARADNDLDFVKSFCQENGIPYSKINEESDHSPTRNTKKPYYNILLDDRAGLFSAYQTLDNFINSTQVRRWRKRNG